VISAHDPRATVVWEITELIAEGGRAPEVLLDAAAAMIGRTLVDSCALGILSNDVGELHPVGLYHRDTQRQRYLDGEPDPVWEPVTGVCETVLSTGKPTLLEYREPDGLQRHSALVVQMRAAGTAVGVMVLSRARLRPPFTEDDLPFAQSVADQLGLAARVLQHEEEIALLLLGATSSASPADRLAVLSDRERRVFRLIGQGLTTTEIGALLSLSVRTVEWHRTRLMSKLGASARWELVALAAKLWP
jgi:DNA-binding CsgD family transcriptional regulator